MFIHKLSDADEANLQKHLTWLAVHPNWYRPLLADPEGLRPEVKQLLEERVAVTPAVGPDWPAITPMLG